ncbi:alpha/beta hydrolase [uncultured Limimaricola sp.]|uniref:alpha/beta fold hydrolase n=1 Tax=uncultured Limimaricola sp. TaxID=2211667 RepID=UPI0030F7F964
MPGNDTASPAMETYTSPTGATLSYEVEGSGPPLVLVHGSFSDHRSNWFQARPRLAKHFTLYALARRGRGESEATKGHEVEDEAKDVEALLERIDEPAFLLGHSYGAQVALAGALLCPGRVRKLILYEPPRPEGPQPIVLERMREAAEAQDWLGVARAFYEGVFELPHDILGSLMASSDWQHIVKDAQASVQDVFALSRHEFDTSRYGALRMPVLLLTGSETPPEMFVTVELADVLANVRHRQFDGEGHEAMNTAPDAFVEAVVAFLSGDAPTHRP